MLHVARCAYLANRYAPVLTRRTVGTALVRGKFGSLIKVWLHPNGSPVGTGTTVDSVQDYSDNNVSIAQATVAKQPLKSATSNVPGFAFDGVNDCLQSASVDFSPSQSVTIALVEYRNNNIVANELEQTASFATSTTAFAALVNDNNIAQLVPAFKGNVGNQVGYYPLAAQQWFPIVYVFDKAQAAANEIRLYARGQALTFNLVASSNNTNGFGAGVLNFGSRDNGASLPLTGSLAQAFVLSTGLTESDAYWLSMYLAQAGGIT